MKQPPHNNECIVYMYKTNKYFRNFVILPRNKHVYICDSSKCPTITVPEIKKKSECIAFLCIFQTDKFMSIQTSKRVPAHAMFQLMKSCTKIKNVTSLLCKADTEEYDIEKEEK